MNPANGRFMTMDTYEGDNSQPLTLHKYVYCQNNPVNLVDPTGMLVEDPLCAGTLSAQMRSLSAAGTSVGRSLAMSRIDAAMSQYVINTIVAAGATAVTGSVICRLRVHPSASVTAKSLSIASLGVGNVGNGGSAAGIGFTTSTSVNFPDGIEFSGANVFGVTAQTNFTAAGFDIALIGYEYSN